jgi:hypothetical protein
MVCQTTAFTYTTRGNEMSDDSDWIYQFIPKTEADELIEEAERIQRIDNTIITLMMAAPMESVIDVVDKWDKAVAGDVLAWMQIYEFTESLIERMREHLDEEGIL